MLRPGEAFALSLSRWKDFEGRSRRSEYWWTFLIVILISFAFVFVDEYFVKTNYPDDFFSGNYGFLQSWWIEFSVYPLTTIATFLSLKCSLTVLVSIVVLPTPKNPVIINDCIMCLYLNIEL